jgi:hypothetical protein
MSQLLFFDFVLHQVALSIRLQGAFRDGFGWDRGERVRFLIAFYPLGGMEVG